MIDITGRMKLGGMKSFVFVSLSEFSDTGRISQIALVSIDRLDLFDETRLSSSELPRIYDKLVLFCADALTSEKSDSSTDKSYFNKVDVRILKGFLARQKTPLAFIFHDDLERNRTILKTELCRGHTVLEGTEFMHCVELHNILHGTIHSKNEFMTKNYSPETIRTDYLNFPTDEGRAIYLVKLSLDIGRTNDFKSSKCSKLFSSSYLVVPEKFMLTSYNESAYDDSSIDDLKSEKSLTFAAREIETFVFLDLETTGLLPKKDAITEIFMTAINRSLCGPLEETQGGVSPPDKLRLAVAPPFPIPTIAEDITKLTTKDLKDRSKLPWSNETVLLIADFLARQPQPLCLIAYNHNNFDANFLRSHISQFRLEKKFSTYFSSKALVGARRLLKEDGRDIGSYTLTNVYAHVVGKEVIAEQHTAEGDTNAMLAIVRNIRKPYSMVLWFNQNKHWFMKNEKVSFPKKRRNRREANDPEDKMENRSDHTYANNNKPAYSRKRKAEEAITHFQFS